MRVKNKELRQRRHRKEQKIKEANRALRLQYGDKKAATPAASKPKSTTGKKPAAPKKAKPEGEA